MSRKTPPPETLLEAVQYFADPDVAHDFVASLKWPNGKQACHHCGTIDEHYFLAKRRVWKCKSCKRQFSVKVGTIFEDSPIALSKWMPAMWMLANCKNGISSYELARAIGVTQKTAWFMLHRIRLAMQSKSFAKLSGEVEIDESFIGGRARFMPASRRKRIFGQAQPARNAGKTVVLGLLERHGKDGSRVVAHVVPGTGRWNLKQPIMRTVEKGSNIFTDAHRAYDHLDGEFVHRFVDHAETYVKDQVVHTNGLENFWSLLKRSIKGTYVAIEPFHVFRYVDEQAFRFNSRKWSDRERFAHAVGSILGRRLTYTALTGVLLGET